MRSNKVSTILGRKVRVGRFGLPVWTIGLAAMGIAAVAGQAVGPVLAGSVTGSVATTVAQTVVLKTPNTTVPGQSIVDATAATYTVDGNIVTTIASDDFVAIASDEGTEFTVAVLTQVGQTTGFEMRLKNLSGNEASFMLELKGPLGIDIAADDAAGDVPALARMGPNSWLGRLSAAADNATSDVRVFMEPKDDLAPGYYTIHGRIIQVR